MEGLKIIQWNCRALGNKIDRLEQFLINSPQDVLVLQEVKLDYHKLPPLDGFAYPPITGKHPNDRKVSVAIYFKDSLVHARTQSPIHPDSNNASCAATIHPRHSNQKALTIVNAYFPRGSDCKYSHDWLHRLDFRNHILVCGDFNSRHHLWENNLNNVTSDNLEEEILNSNLIILNDGTPTRIPDNCKQMASAIDLTLVSAGIEHTTWDVVENTLLNSDHLPIQISIDSYSGYEQATGGRPKYVYKRANWEIFQLSLRNSIIEEQSKINTEEYYRAVRNSILAAADLAIPKKVPQQNRKNKQGKSWWNDRCRLAVDKKYKATRRYRLDQSAENHRLMKEANIAVSKVIAESKLENLESFVSTNIKSHMDTGAMWRKVKQIKNKGRPPPKPLIVNGVKFITDREKAEILAEHIAKCSQKNSLTDTQLSHRRQFDLHFTHSDTNVNNQDFNQVISVAEVVDAIGDIKNVDRQTGQDPISYTMIKHFPKPFIGQLGEFFNYIFKKHEIPVDWKQAEVIALAKPGKPSQEPGSYRPISLTSHLCKVYERIMKNRLTHYLEKNSLIAPEQAGFRKGRSTMDHVVSLGEKLKKTLRREKYVRLGTFFDIAKAYDRVWHNKLLSKIQDMQIEGNMYGFIREFITDRKMRVRSGSNTSSLKTLEMGVPQGSVIAPTLFLIMINDVVKAANERNKCMLYADDLSIISDNFCAGFSAKNLELHQEAINSAQATLAESGLELAAEKTAFLVFSRLPVSHHKYDYHIKLDKARIDPVSSVKFLGVTISNKMDWSKHITNLVNKARKQLNLIKILAGIPWLKGTKLMVDITIALIRSRLTYGQEVYFGAPEVALNKLEATDRTALRIALGVNCRASSDLVYEEAGQPPLREYRKVAAAKFVIRSQLISDNPTKIDIDFKTHDGSKQQMAYERAVLERDKTGRRYKEQENIRIYTHVIWNHAQLPLEMVENYVLPKVSPWIARRAEFVFTIPVNVKKQDNPVLCGSIAKEYIDRELSEFEQLYTDGSRLPTGEVGCAVVAKINGRRVANRVKLNSKVSIFSAELQAIKHALDIAAPLQNKKNVAILTDSKSSMQALQSKPKHRYRLHSEISLLIHRIVCSGRIVRFVHIPSHTGISGNESADKQANIAAQDNNMRKEHINIGYTKSEVYSMIEKIAKDKLPGYKNKKNFVSIPLPPGPLNIVRKIRTQGGKFNIPEFNTLCVCGNRLESGHLLGECNEMLKHLPKTDALIKEHKLKPEEMCTQHATLGWRHTVTLAWELYHSPVACLI